MGTKMENTNTEVKKNTEVPRRTLVEALEKNQASIFPHALWPILKISLRILNLKFRKLFLFNLNIIFSDLIFQENLARI